MPFVGCCALVYFWTLRFSRIGDFWTLRLGFFGNLDLRIIHCDRTNVYKIFQKSSIDSSMLYRISCILGYDFFSEYTQSFDKGVAKKSTNS